MSVVTPLDILDYWIGPARDNAEAAKRQHGLWFGKSAETDHEIAERFLPTLAALASGLADDWASRGPRARLAAIIALDQFTRNIFRGKRHAFENDHLALALTKAGLARRHHAGLMEVEQIFFYLPLEHSERAEDQALAVALCERLAHSARAEFVPLADSTLDYARRHQAVIERFGRFPHRNAALGRGNTPEETEYLSRPGAGF